jgi:hypothetical protein
MRCRDAERLFTSQQKASDIVIHAAAMKRIEKCETDPIEAVKDKHIWDGECCERLSHGTIYRTLFLSRQTKPVIR